MATTQSGVDDVARIKSRLERFQLSNADLSQQLSDALGRSQRLASSLGFRDIYEAQALIDTADSDLSYRQCLRELDVLKAQVRDLTAERDSALTRVREWEGQEPRMPPKVSDGLHLRDLVPDEIAVDVLPYALRLAHCEVSGLRQCDADDLPAEGSIRMYELADSSLDIMRKNAKVVREWEDMFSFENKDRKSKISRLTRKESFYFQRALYRIMLVCWLYGMGSIPESDMKDENYPYGFYKTYQTRQTKFLTKYPVDDLFEINRVVRFLVYIAGIIMVKSKGFESVRYTYDWDGLYLFAGPAFIMNAYHNREVDANEDADYQELCSYIDDDGPYSKFLTCGLDDALRTGTAGVFDKHFQKRVLDSVEGGDDPCTKCQSDPGFYRAAFLINESSWDRLKFTHLLLDTLFLLSRVGISYPETKEFFDEIRKTPSRELIADIFELRQGQYASWEPEDWVCGNCYSDFIYDTISTWWAKRRSLPVRDSAR